MKCQSLFSGKNKKKKSKCLLLKFLPSMLSVKQRILIQIRGISDNIRTIGFVNCISIDTFSSDANSSEGNAINENPSRFYVFIYLWNVCKSKL